MNIIIIFMAKLIWFISEWTNSVLTFYHPRFCHRLPRKADSHKSGANVWKDFVHRNVRKQARKRTYTIMSYPENLVLSDASFAGH